MNPAPYLTTGVTIPLACPVARHKSCEAGGNGLCIEGISGILHKFNAKLVLTA
jgi:hypothetical protein